MELGRKLLALAWVLLFACIYFDLIKRVCWKIQNYLRYNGNKTNKMTHFISHITQNVV